MTTNDQMTHNEITLNLLFDLGIVPKELKTWGYSNAQITKLYSPTKRTIIHNVVQFVPDFQRVVGGVMFFKGIHYDFMKNKMDVISKEQITDRFAIELHMFCLDHNIDLKFWVNK